MPFSLMTSNTSLVMVSAVLLLAGCDKSDTKTATTPANTSASSVTSTVISTSATTSIFPTPSSTATQTTNAVAIDLKTFSGHETAGAMAVAMSNFMVKNLNSVSDLQKLPDDKKSCLINSNHPGSLANFDSYLAKKLSADELKKTNAFYSTELGQKLIVASDQKIKQQAGLTFASPITLNEDDNTKLKAFSTTPEGKKLMTLFSPANQLEMQRDVIEPMMKAEFDKCDVKVAGVN